MTTGNPYADIGLTLGGSFLNNYLNKGLVGVAKQAAEQQAVDQQRGAGMYSNYIQPLMGASVGESYAMQPARQALLMALLGASGVSPDSYGAAMSGQRQLLETRLAEAQRQLDAALARGARGGLDAGQRAELAATRQKYTDEVRALQDQLSAMPTSGGGAAGPSWMTPDWRNPFTPEQQSSFLTLSKLGLEGAAQNEKNNLARFYASRGTPMSSEQAGYTPGFSRWYNTAASGEKAKLGMLGLERGDQLRREQQGNYFNILNALSPNNQTSALPSWANYFGNSAQAAGNTAQQYANMGGQNAFNLQNSLMGTLGDWWNQRRQRPQAQQAPQATGTWPGALTPFSQTPYSTGGNYGLKTNLWGP